MQLYDFAVPEVLGILLCMQIPSLQLFCSPLPEPIRQLRLSGASDAPHCRQRTHLHSLPARHKEHQLTIEFTHPFSISDSAKIHRDGEFALFKLRTFRTRKRSGRTSSLTALLLLPTFSSSKLASRLHCIQTPLNNHSIT
jgi:hypothetical protein